MCPGKRGSWLHKHYGQICELLLLLDFNSPICKWSTFQNMFPLKPSRTLGSHRPKTFLCPSFLDYRKYTSFRLHNLPWVPTSRFSSVQFSHSVMSNSLWPHGLQHARLPCPSPSPGACSNSCPLSLWCHPTISSPSPPAFRRRSFPASGSFLMSQFFASGGQSIEASASASVLPMNIQDCFPLGWTGWISLLSQGLSRVFSNTTVQKHQFFGTQLSLWSNSHIHMWLWKNHSFD